jgi:hypothetical protein
MIFSKKQKSAGQRKQAASSARLHSIAALLEGRHFAGDFEVATASYKFTYAPVRAELDGRRLVLEGRLGVTGPRGRLYSRERVKARLVSTQGGIGPAPIRRQVLVGGVATGTAATSGQQQQIAAEPPKAGEVAPAKTTALPEIDSTDALSFCGVMYFLLEPLGELMPGVAVDLSHVQLNARLAPTDEIGRELHSLYSLIVASLYGKEAQTKAARDLIDELNKLLN